MLKCQDSIAKSGWGGPGSGLEISECILKLLEIFN